MSQPESLQPHVNTEIRVVFLCSVDRVQFATEFPSPASAATGNGNSLSRQRFFVKPLTQTHALWHMARCILHLAAVPPECYLALSFAVYVIGACPLPGMCATSHFISIYQILNSSVMLCSSLAARGNITYSNTKIPARSTNVSGTTVY